MNQTRAFLLFAWLMVATLLWMEWGKEQAAPATPASATATTSAQGDSTVPSAAAMPVPSAPLAGTTPSVPQASATPVGSTRAAETITVETDVLRLTLDGGSVRSAELLRYPQDTKTGSAPVQLFDTRSASYFVAQSGWVSNAGGAPSHEAGFVPATATRS